MASVLISELLIQVQLLYETSFRLNNNLNGITAVLSHIFFTDSSSLLQMLREILVQEMLGVEDLSPMRFRI